MHTQEELLNSNYVLFADNSIKQAMEAITYNRRGCTVVIDADWKLMGVLSDGDLRRALIKGAVDVTPVEKIVNLNPITMRDTDTAAIQNVQEFFENHAGVNVIPVVDENNKVLDILVKRGFYKNHTTK